MKKTLKTSAFVLSLLLGTCFFAQTNVYAKENSGKAHGKSKVQTTKAHEKAVKSAEKTIPYGLAKKALPPVIKQGGILIPVNAVTKSLGANLVWDSENQIVTITKEDKTIVINLINKTATVNGTEVALPQNIATEVTDTTLGNESTVTEETNATSAPEGKPNNGRLVLFNFIVQNLGMNLDENQIEQISDEALLSDNTQTTGIETIATESTSNITTDVQTLTDSQNQ